MNILIVDDHPMVLHSLCILLAARGHEAQGAENVQTATALLGERRWDVLLLDYHLQNESGLELLRAAGVPTPRWVVLLSGLTEREDILRGFDSGVHAFIPKTVSPDDLLTALTELDEIPPPHGGAVWMPQEKRFRSIQEAFQRETLLSGKEREVFLLMRQGLLDKQIADALGISIHTVRVHIRSIRRKRDVARRGGR